MIEYNVFIMPEKIYSKPIEYVLKLLAHNQQIKFNFIPNKENAELIFDDNDFEHTLPIAVDFYRNLLVDNQYSYKFHFKGECAIKNNEDQDDFIALAFYMINCFQEYSEESDSYDKFGRFLFEKSYQHEYDNIEDNLTQKALGNFCLRFLKGHSLRKINSRLFISHDIDTINGAILQDGYWALKHKRIDIILKLIFNAGMLRPDWKNMDKIMNINDEYSIKSTFFWLVNKGKGLYGIKNADYNCTSLKPLMKRIEKKGSFNGIHKSCSNDSLQEEIKKFPLNAKYNRFHFLRYKIPDLWDQLSNSQILIDFSLGHAQRYGFRNNYGFPFKPYNLKTQSAYSFIEVPLNMMDSTFHRYMKIPSSKTADEIINFIKKNQSNCILSLLWHNTYFSDFKYHGYLDEYKKIMGYIYEMKIDHITPAEILKEFGNGE